ncbi:MAG: Xaa-Pro peptidase family protein [Anaerolineales bacterium]|jgi:Xaa-Pro dipeptidase
MPEAPFFPDEEYNRRLQRLRGGMAKRDLDACLISGPENIYYLTGLSHQGFFAYHILIVPQAGEMHLIARAMERPTVEALVRNAKFIGYADSDDPSKVTHKLLKQMGLSSARIGLEKSSLFLPVRIAEGISAELPEVYWSDISNLLANLRLIKSPLEQKYVRQAAAVSDAMLQAALSIAQAGVSEREIAAEVYRAMVLAGGEYPGFHPFIRSTRSLGREHETWSDYVLKDGDMLFLEMAGCVRRYHAPLGRLIFVGQVPLESRQIETVCLEAFENVVQAIQPGVKAGGVYQAWQERVDAAGLSHYRRHHCGYLVGIGFPPSWTGGVGVIGLRHDSELILQPGMVFHLMSWLMGSGRGDYFVSDTALLTETGCQVLTTVPQHLQVV